MVIATVIVFFVGQVKCPHHPDQLSERSQASKVTLDCFENLKIVSSQVVPGIENIFVFKDVFFVVSLSFSSNSGMFSHKLFGKCPYGNNTFQKGASLWNWVKMMILKVCKIGMCHIWGHLGLMLKTFIRQIDAELTLYTWSRSGQSLIFWSSLLKWV